MAMDLQRTADLDHDGSDERMCFGSTNVFVCYVAGRHSYALQDDELVETR